MTIKQQKFADKYLVTGNATLSYTYAYKVKNENTAKSAGQRLLTNVDVKQYIDKKREKLSQKAGITQERVMQEIGRLAFSDIRQLFDSNSNLLDIKKLPDDIAAVISSIEVDEITSIGRINKKQKGVIQKIKLWSKEKALEMLAKHFSLYNDAPEPPQVNFNFANLSPLELKTLLDLKQKISA